MKKIIASVTLFAFILTSNPAYATNSLPTFFKSKIRVQQPIEGAFYKAALAPAGGNAVFDFVSNMRVFAQDEPLEFRTDVIRSNLFYLINLQPQLKKMLIRGIRSYCGINKAGKRLLEHTLKYGSIDEQLLHEFVETTPHEKIGWIAQHFMCSFLYKDRPAAISAPSRDAYSSIPLVMSAYRMTARADLIKRAGKQDAYGERSLHIFNSRSRLPLIDALIGLDVEAIENDTEAINISQAQADDFIQHINKADGSIRFIEQQRRGLPGILKESGADAFEHITLLNGLRDGHIKQDEMPLLADELLRTIRNNGTLTVTQAERPYIEFAAKKAGIKLEVFQDGLPTLYTDVLGNVTRFFPETRGTIFLVSGKDKFAQMPQDSWVAVQLVAGKGTRLESSQDIPKPARLLAGRPIGVYFKEVMNSMSIPIVAVVGFGRHKMREILGIDGVTYAVQGTADGKGQLGVADAFMKALNLLKDYKGRIIFAPGDVAGIDKTLIENLQKAHSAPGEKPVGMTMVTTFVDNPYGYGRVVRGKDGSIKKIVSQKYIDRLAEKGDRMTLDDRSEFTTEELADIKEIDTAIFAFDVRVPYEVLKQVRPSEASPELQLIDIVELFAKRGYEVRSIVEPDSKKVEGINTPEQLAAMDAYLRQRAKLSKLPVKVAVVIGTRPELEKLAPVIHTLRSQPPLFECHVIFTGQHKREVMQPFLDVFDLHYGDYDLGLAEKTQGRTLNQRQAELIPALESVLCEIKPDVVVCQGDTLSAKVAADVAWQLESPLRGNVKVAHLEAGLRSWDVRAPYPEEAYRKGIDAIADMYFCPTLLSQLNLLKEGRQDLVNVFVIGNTIVDALDYAAKKEYPLPFDLPADKKIVVATFHRTENIGQPMENIVSALIELAASHKDIYIVAPLHVSGPDIKNAAERLSGYENIKIVEPLGYGHMLALLSKSWLILTDSGGMQEQAPYFRKPVLILRDKTERPEVLMAGAGKLVGTEKDVIVSNVEELLTNETAYKLMSDSVNPFGDGRAALRAAEAILYQMGVNIEPPQPFVSAVDEQIRQEYSSKTQADAAGIKMEPITITIDGQANVGKTSVARALSRRLGGAFLSLGYLYRLAALAAAEEKLDIEDTQDRARLMSLLNENISFSGIGKKLEIYYKGNPISKKLELQLRRPEIEFIGSRLAPIIRGDVIEFAKKAAARMHDNEINFVVEGRKEAHLLAGEKDLKITLSAPPDVRAERAGAGTIDRDRTDAENTEKWLIENQIDIDLLRQGAVEIDTGSLTVRQVVNKILPLVSDRFARIAADNLRVGKYQEAVAYFNRAVETFPHNRQLLNFLWYIFNDGRPHEKIAAALAIIRWAEIKGIKVTGDTKSTAYRQFFREIRARAESQKITFNDALSGYLSEDARKAVVSVVEKYNAGRSPPRTVTLVNLSSPNHPAIYEPLGLEVLHSEISRRYQFYNRFKPEILDMQTGITTNDIIRHIKENKPAVVGLSLKLGTYKAAKELLDRIFSAEITEDERPLVVLGSSIPTYAAERILEDYKDVIVVIGEGEMSLTAILENLDVIKNNNKDALKVIPNLVFIDESGKIALTERKPADLANVAIADRSHMSLLNKDHMVYALMESSRGCNKRCSFCERNIYRAKKGWEPYPVERVVDEAEDLAILGITDINFIDDDYVGQDINRAKTIAEAMLGRGLRTRYMFSTRADNIYNPRETSEENRARENAFVTMERSGLRRIFVGLESGVRSQRLRYAKGLQKSAINGMLSRLKRLNMVEFEPGYIAFDPRMSFEELEKTISFIDAAALTETGSRIFGAMRLQEGTDYLSRIKNRYRYLLTGEYDINYVSYGYRFEDERVSRVYDTFKQWEDEQYGLVYAVQGLIREGSLEKTSMSEFQISMLEFLLSFRRLDLEVLKSLKDAVKAADSSESVNISKRYRRERLNMATRLLEQIQKQDIALPTEVSQMVKAEAIGRNLRDWIRTGIWDIDDYINVNVKPALEALLGQTNLFLSLEASQRERFINNTAHRWINEYARIKSYLSLTDFFSLVAAFSSTEEEFYINSKSFEALAAKLKEKVIASGVFVYAIPGLKNVIKRPGDFQEVMMLANNLAENDMDPTHVLRFGIPAVMDILTPQDFQQAMSLANHLAKEGIDPSITFLSGIPDVVKYIESPEQFQQIMAFANRLAGKKIDPGNILCYGMPPVIKLSDTPENFHIYLARLEVLADQMHSQNGDWPLFKGDIAIEALTNNQAGLIYHRSILGGYVGERWVDGLSARLELIYSATIGDVDRLKSIIAASAAGRQDDENIVQELLGDKNRGRRLEAARRLKDMVKFGELRSEAKTEVDLHLHTYYSDGYQTPTAAVYEAYLKGLKAIAITDHNSFKGIPEALEAGEIFGIEVIPGIEIETDEEGIEILGYFPDKDMEWFKTRELSELPELIQKAQSSRIKVMLKNISTELPDYPLLYEEVMEISRHKLPSLGNLYSAFRDKYYDRLCSEYPNEPININKVLEFVLIKKFGSEYQDKLDADGNPTKEFIEAVWKPIKTTEFENIRPEAGISPEAVINYITQIGGIPILAHPSKIQERLGLTSKEVVDKIEEEFVPLGLAGIEVISGKKDTELLNKKKLSKEDIDSYRQYAKEPLLATIGSDYHGKESPGTEMARGGISEEYPEGNMLPELGKYDIVQQLKNRPEVQMAALKKFEKELIRGSASNKNLILIVAKEERIAQSSIPILLSFGFKNIYTVITQERIDYIFNTQPKKVDLIINKAPEGSFNIPEGPMVFSNPSNKELKREISQWLITTKADASGREKLQGRLIELLGEPLNISLNADQINALVKQLRLPRLVRPVIVAAGKGTRYQDSLPLGIKMHNKSVAEINGIPAVRVVLDNVLSLSGNRKIKLLKPAVIVSVDNEDEVRQALVGYDVDYVLQEPVVGTGDAVLRMRNIDKDFTGDYLIVWSTMAVVRPKTLEDSIRIAQSIKDCIMVYPAAWRKEPYAPLKTKGAIVLNSEETHLEAAQAPEYGLDNIGAFVVDAQALFDTLGAYDKQFDAAAGIYKGLPGGELGLPNTLGRDLPKAGKLVIAAPIADPRECQGIKTYEDIKTAENYRLELLVSELINKGTVEYVLPNPADDVKSVDVSYTGNINPEEPSYTIYVKSKTGEVLSVLNVKGWSYLKNNTALHVDRVATVPDTRRIGLASLLMRINECIAGEIIGAKVISLRAKPFDSEVFFTPNEAEEVKQKGDILRNFYEKNGYNLEDGQSWPVWNPDRKDGWSNYNGYYEGEWPVLVRRLVTDEAALVIGPDVPQVIIDGFVRQGFTLNKDLFTASDLSQARAVLAEKTPQFEHIYTFNYTGGGIVIDTQEIITILIEGPDPDKVAAKLDQARANARGVLTEV